MKLGNDKKLDQAVYMWFKQRRMKEEAISGPLLCEKAVELSERLHVKTSFKASLIGSGGFVSNMVFVNFQFKEKSCLETRKKPINL